MNSSPRLAERGEGRDARYQKGDAEVGETRSSKVGSESVMLLRSMSTCKGENAWCMYEVGDSGLHKGGDMVKRRGSG